MLLLSIIVVVVVVVVMDVFVVVVAVDIGWFKKSCDSEYSFVGNSSGLIACIPSIQPLNYKKQKTNIGKRENKRHSLKCIRIMREMSHRVSKK